MAKFSGIQKNAVIDLVAPASRCSQVELSDGLDVIRSWGYQPRLPKRVFNTHPYLSQTDEYRVETLKNAIMSKDSEVIWAIRGGYGSARLVNQLRKLKPKRKKVFIGYSDNSWLHHLFYELWGWQGLHASLISELGGNKLSQKTRITLKKYLASPESIEFTGLVGLNGAAMKTKAVKGQVCGGNLAVLQTTLGTNYSFNAKNKILFLEDVGERGYAIDRMLTHMSAANAFKGARAIVFGEFLGGDETDGKNHIRRAVNDFAQNQKIPVLRGLKSGHGSHNIPVPLYQSSLLQLGAKPKLTIDNK